MCSQTELRRNTKRRRFVRLAHYSLGKQFNVANNLNNLQLGNFLNEYEVNCKNLDAIKEEAENTAEVEDIFN